MRRRIVEIGSHGSPSPAVARAPSYAVVVSLPLARRDELEASRGFFRLLIPPPAMKACLVILLAVGVFGEESEEISDALVEEGINQLTSEISEDELKSLGQSATLDFS